MKAISIILGLIIGITSATIAQKADSIVVTFDNQHIIIPLPAFGKQTTIKMADSIQMIEISVSRRGINEAGYTLSTLTYDSYFYQQGANFQGYKLGFSVREKERNISNKTTFVTGFKLGYEQSFRNGNAQLTGDSAVYRSSFYKMLFPVAGKHKIAAFSLPAYVSFGANFIVGYSFITRKNNSNTESIYDNGLFFLEPFLGIEINKIGLCIASSRNLSPDMSFYNPVKAVNSISLTYRFN